MGWTILLDWRLWLGLAFVGLGAWAAIQTSRLHGCQDRLAASQQMVENLEDRIRLQNAAVERLKAESDKKTAAAATGLQEARQATQPAVRESARLRSAAAKTEAPDVPREANCQPSGADRAVATLREGL